MSTDLEEPLEWRELAEYPDRSSAELDAGYLRSGGVAARVVGFDSFPGHGRCRILVDASLEHRACWLLKDPPVSEAELEFLATGEFPEPKQEG